MIFFFLMLKEVFSYHMGWLSLGGLISVLGGYVQWEQACHARAVQLLSSVSTGCAEDVYEREVCPLQSHRPGRLRLYQSHCYETTSVDVPQLL